MDPETPRPFLSVVSTLVSAGIGIFGLEMGKQWWSARREREAARSRAQAAQADKEISAERVLRAVLEQQIEDLRHEKRLEIEDLRRDIERLEQDIIDGQERFSDIDRENAVLRTLPCRLDGCPRLKSPLPKRYPKTAANG